MGIDAISEMVSGGSGLGIGFAVLPQLFSSWGWFGTLSGLMWFGLLFFAGITSSMAMGTPLICFMRDNFAWKDKHGAYLFGILIFIFGIPTVLSQDAFNEYDYWAGTVSLVVFAMVEIVLFAWVLGMDKAWDEITRGADIKVTLVFKYIIKYVSPVFLIIVFVGALPDIIKNATAETSLYGWLGRAMLLVLFVGIAVLVSVAKRKKLKS